MRATTLSRWTLASARLPQAKAFGGPWRRLKMTGRRSKIPPRSMAPMASCGAGGGFGQWVLDLPLSWYWRDASSKQTPEQWPGTTAPG